MTQVMKAEYRQNENYPIFVSWKSGFETLSRDEAVNLIGELLDAVNESDRKNCGAWRGIIAHGPHE